MITLVAQLKKNIPDLKEAEIEGILFLIIKNEGITNTQLIQKTGLPKETLRQFKAIIAHILENSEDDSIHLTVEGRHIVSALKPQPYKWAILDYSQDSIFLEEVSSFLRGLRQEKALNSNRELDQFFATENTSIAKAKILQDRGQVKGKKIAFLGDDDLVSVVLGKLDNSFEQIVVFDLDDKILDAINIAANNVGLDNITTIKYDVRDDMLKKYLGFFDVVVTDPPYTKAGIQLFLAKSIEMTKNPQNNSGPYIFLAYGNSFKTPEKALKIQELIQSSNLLIEDKIEKFHRYNGAESIGSASSLYILKKTKFTQIPQNLGFPEIYTFQNTKMETFPFVDHVVLKLYDVPPQLINSRKPLLKALTSFCNTHKLHIVDTKVTNFKPFGITVTLVLSNSNLVVHTWPEDNALHIDLITCKPIFQKELLHKTAENIFKTKYVESRFVE